MKKNTSKRLFRSLLTALLVFSVGYGVLLAQSSTDSVEVEITVTARPGTFNAFLCAGMVSGIFVPLSEGQPLFPDGETAQQGSTTDGQIAICYEDTYEHRGGFDVSLSADDFIHEDDEDSFSADNLSIQYTVQTTQGRSGPGVGDIDGLAENGTIIPKQSAAPVSWINGGLSESRAVGVGAEGAGTHDPSGPLKGAFQGLGLRLTVPNDAMPGSYTTTIHLTVAPSSP